MTALKYIIPILWTTLSHPVQAASAPRYSVQIFGDFFWPHSAEARPLPDAQDALSELLPVLQSAAINIVNFEGVATDALMPHVLKSHLLRMPTTIGGFLSEHKIQVATLANNHSMDFGAQGLFDSLSVLHEAGVQTTGADLNLSKALQPIAVPLGRRTFCIMAVNRTLPYEFYATATTAGTNSPRFKDIAEQVRVAKLSCDFVVSVFHWGWENSNLAQNYQYKLAQAVIDAGADAVVGHHPHTLQEHVIYKGKPIFFSLGNFLLGTLPRYSKPDGMGVRFLLDEQLHLTGYEILPLVVDNTEISFRPRLAATEQENKVTTILKSGTACHLKADSQIYECAVTPF